MGLQKREVPEGFLSRELGKHHGPLGVVTMAHLNVSQHGPLLVRI